MVVQSFLWALAQQEDIKPQVIQCYQRLSQLGNVMAQHKLAVLTGLFSFRSELTLLRRRKEYLFCQS
jgi:hypothetical protein